MKSINIIDAANQGGQLFKIFNTDGKIEVTTEHPGVVIAFAVGDNPKVAFFDGYSLPIEQLTKYSNVIFYVLNSKPVKISNRAVVTFKDRKKFINIASIYEQNINLFLLEKQLSNKKTF